MVGDSEDVLEGDGTTCACILNDFGGEGSSSRSVSKRRRPISRLFRRNGAYSAEFNYIEFLLNYQTIVRAIRCRVRTN